jgi:hypothetical protein
MAWMQNEDVVTKAEGADAYCVVEQRGTRERMQAGIEERLLLLIALVILDDDVDNVVDAAKV